MVLLEITVVVRHMFDLVNGHAAPDSAMDGALFVPGEIPAGNGANKHQDLLHVTGELLLLGLEFSRRLEVGLPYIAQQLPGDFFNGQNVVCKTGVYGAPWHSVIFCTSRVLDNGHPAGLLNCLEPQGAVTTGS